MSLSSPRPVASPLRELALFDVVRLRSGGPPMTIVAWPLKGDDDLVACAWFAEGGYLSARFRLGSLTRAEPDGRTLLREYQRSCSLKAPASALQTAGLGRG